MNRSDLVELVAERAGSDRAVARRHVDAVFEAIIDGVAAGDRVLVTGFGTFDRFDRPARTARNPRTGEAIEVAAGAVPRFRFGQTFKHRVAQANGAPAEAEVPEVQAAETAPAVTETVRPKKAKDAKKPKKKDKKAAAKKPAKSAKAAAKPGKKGSGKKAAKAR